MKVCPHSDNYTCASQMQLTLGSLPSMAGDDRPEARGRATR